MVQNFLNELKYSLRQKWLGNWVLRRTPPNLPLLSNRYQENQFYQLLLGSIIPQDQAEKFTQIIDVGCRNWSYLSSLASYFPNAKLTGIEVDGKRRYWNLYRRMDLAQAQAETLRLQGRKVEFHCQDFLSLSLQFHPEKTNSEQQGLFCFLYPFVSKDPCLDWGLPARFSDYGALLSHSRKLSDSAGLPFFWMTVHQGDWEADEARKIYHEWGFKMKELQIKSEQWQDFWPSRYDAWIFYGTALTKQSPEPIF